MRAGTARGVDVGDEFTLYGDPQPSPKSPPLGTFVVREARSFDSTIVLSSGTPRFERHKPAFALLTRTGTKQDFHVFVAGHKKLTHTFEALVRMQNRRPERPRILEVEKGNAKLGIDLDEGQVVFDILDERVTAFGLRRIPFSAEPDPFILYDVLNAAARFHWHLHRTPEKHYLQNKVRLEFTKLDQLEGKSDEDPDGDVKSVIVGENLNQNGLINLVASDSDGYGIKIINDTNQALYASLFYFDNSNLSISTCLPCTLT